MGLSSDENDAEVPCSKSAAKSTAHDGRDATLQRRRIFEGDGTWLKAYGKSRMHSPAAHEASRVLGEQKPEEETLATAVQAEGSLESFGGCAPTQLLIATIRGSTSEPQKAGMDGVEGQGVEHKTLMRARRGGGRA